MTSKAQIELTAIDKTRAAFDSANRNLQSMGQRVSTLLPMLGRIGPAMAAGIGTASIGGAVAGLGALIKAQADAIDQFNDLKDATGASIENLSALDDVARRNGMSLDSVGSALVRFNAALKEGDKSGVLKALNLDVEKLKQLDPAEALRQTAVALSGYADDGNKARAVQELFGKSVREVAPLLKDLSEQGSLVAKVTTQQAEEAEKFNKQLFAMQANMNELGRAIANPVIGAFNSLAEAFKTSKREGDSLLETIAKFSPQGAALRAMGLIGNTNGFTEARENVATLQRGLSDTSLTASERAAMQRELAREQARLDGYLNSNAGAGRGMGGYEGVPRGSLTLPPEAAKGAKAGRAKASRVKDAPEFAVDSSDALSRHLAALARERKADEEIAQELARLADGGDARKRQLTAALESQLNAGVIFTPDELDRIVRGIGGVRQEFADTNEVVKNLKDGANDFGGAFTSALDDVLSRSKSLSDVLAGLARNVLSIGLQKAITQPLGNMLGGAMTAGFGSMFSFDGGGYTGNRPRMGGLDGKGGFMAMLHPQETVVDHAKGGKGGNQTVIRQSIVVNATDNASRGDLARAVEFGQRQAMARSRRAEVYGG